MLNVECAMDVKSEILDKDDQEFGLIVVRTVMSVKSIGFLTKK